MVRLRLRRPETTAETTAPDVYPVEAAVDDHGLHVKGETCARCGEPILPTDEARRTATGGCVHLCC